MAPQQPRRPRPTWLRFVQVGLTLALALFLFRSVDWGAFWGAIGNLRWEYMGLAAAFFACAHGCNILRWRGLLTPGGPPLATLVAYYGAGLFSSNFLPSGVGGDGVRAALAGRHTSWARALASVAADRLIGLAGLGFFVIPGLWLGLPSGVAGALPVLEPATSAAWVLAAGAAALSLGLGGRIAWRHSPRLREAVAYLGRGDGPWLALQARVAAMPRLFLRAYAFSLGSSLALLAAHGAVLAALNADVLAAAVIWVVIVSAFAQMLPISVNGLGLLESVFVVVLGSFGIVAPTALAAALLIRALGLAYSFAGGLLSLRESVV